ncbi:MAG: GNAT family N-acetyltransferase [Sulfitobacter sp.]|nr:GNAT family N-acetyltransferase [Sulfitobacter sp.]
MGLHPEGEVLDITISKGFTAAERSQIAALYWEAFGPKLSVVLGPEEKGLAFVTAQLQPGFALVARDPSSNVIGVAGFKTAEGAFVGGGLRDLAAVFGWLSVIWRAPLLSLVERDLDKDILLMDGICVGPQARGHGVGTALLCAIKEEARQRGKSAVRLDVIDTNPRAKALYLREGFTEEGEERLGPLSRIFGFGSATRMLCQV